MKIPNDILLLKPPEEEFQEEEGEGKDHFVDADSGSLADPVDRGDRNVLYPEIIDVQLDKKVVRHPVALVDGIQIEGLEHLQGRSRVTGLRVGNVPVTGCDLGE